MPGKKVVPVRFYAETDADLIEWLEGLAAGEGNHSIKAMLRAGIAASKNDKCHLTPTVSGASTGTLDPANLQAALESFLPRIREIVDASLASVSFAPAGSEIASQVENTASTEILKGHFLGEDENE